jgi:TonB-dependent SusC/RagA subfamily outer membrane receptor
MRIKLTIIAFLLISGFQVFSSNKNPKNSTNKTPQSSPQKIQQDFSQTIASRFTNQWYNFSQEKVYLQTDKPYYSAGEEIWFKGYLVNATTIEPVSKSQFLYVELIDKMDSVHYRVKINKDSLGFAGHIKLNAEIPAGNYTLRAYTYWMQNAGKDFFFSKNISIGNSIDDRVTRKITYGTPENGKIPVTLSFINASLNPISKKKVEITQDWKSSKKKKIALTTNSEGKINWEINVDPQDSSQKVLAIDIKDEKYTSNIFLPEFNKDFDVQFFPEGGNLLDNDLQTIAFKAIGRNGLSVDVSGKIFTNKNEEITDIASINKGMGKFSLQTQPGETYYALIKTAEGTEKRFELPKTVSESVVIHLVYNRGKILYEVVNNTKLPNNALYLLLHSKGKVFVLQSLKNKEGIISENLLPAGIVSFSVIDSLGNTFSERLSFIRPLNLPVLKMESDKPSYGKREHVDLKLNVQSLTGKPVNGSYSISITDKFAVKQDSLKDNILSNLLLTSDIKGYVEDPGSYFTDNKTTTREKTDLLMLTQGWKRFNTADVIKGVIKQPKFYLEAGQALSGKVTNLFNAPSKKCDVIAISPYKNVFRMAKTDSVGRYLIEGIEFPDSTSFILKAKKKGSITDVEIIPDEDNFPESHVFIPTPTLTQDAKNEAQDEYLKMSKEKYYYEGGMRVISLGEVTVKADKKPDKNSTYYSGMADTEITSEMLDRNPSMSFMNLLYTVPGIMVSGDKISIRGSLNSPMILLDEIEIQDISEVSYLTGADIESIQVFKGASAAIFGSRGGDGVIAIRLKEGVQLKASSQISLIKVTPFGYQKPKDFYVPKYDVDSELNNTNPDLRTTIYWNPKLSTDAEGNINVKFFTADKTNDYSVVLEGITKTGEICRFEGILKRVDK